MSKIDHAKLNKKKRESSQRIEVEADRAKKRRLKLNKQKRRADDSRTRSFVPITDKQRALMIKLGIPFDNQTTLHDASNLISDFLDRRKQNR